jgi:hypothetical protein
MREPADDFTPIEYALISQARIEHDFTRDEIFGGSLWDLWMERELEIEP